ncbi:MAG: Sapep family Mn(2+)-dependent dipeptidase [Clostridia bacterium]|nr:Sapep family Mn(2+)-dependent dipeptidase [Clostridia bacterium]
MNLRYDTEIKQWIDENKDSLLNEWIEIAKVPAILGEPECDAPFGKACAEGLEKCTKLFSDRGFSAEIFKESGYALVTMGSGEKTIGIFSHSDVVPVGDDWLFTKPFEPVIKDGALIGRGVEDNKSGIMAALCAMEIIRKYNIPLKSRLQLFIGSNEETGMKDIDAFVNEQPMPEISLIPDADFPCSTGEKGICHFFASCDTSCTDVLDFCGGEAFNIVLDKAKATLKYSKELETELCNKSNGQITVSTTDNFIEVEAKGIAKHASDPDGSINAAYLLAELFASAAALPQSDREIMAQIKHILSCPFGTSMELDHCDDLFGRLTFVNGIVSLENGHIKLSFDMRYSSALDHKQLEERAINAFKSLGWSTKIDSNMKGFSISADSKIPQKFEDIYREVTGIEKKSIKLGGGTYARKLENAFSVGTFTTTAEHPEPQLKMPAGHGGAHQCDEMIDIESFFTAVKIITQYILAMDEEINK